MSNVPLASSKQPNTVVLKHFDEFGCVNETRYLAARARHTSHGLEILSMKNDEVIAFEAHGFFIAFAWVWSAEAEELQVHT